MTGTLLNTLSGHFYSPVKFIFYLVHFGRMTTDGTGGLGRVKQRRNVRFPHSDQVRQRYLRNLGQQSSAT